MVNDVNHLWSYLFCPKSNKINFCVNEKNVSPCAYLSVLEDSTDEHGNRIYPQGANGIWCLLAHLSEMSEDNQVYPCVSPDEIGFGVSFLSFPVTWWCYLGDLYPLSSGVCVCRSPPALVSCHPTHTHIPRSLRWGGVGQGLLAVSSLDTPVIVGAPLRKTFCSFCVCLWVLCICCPFVGIWVPSLLWSHMKRKNPHKPLPGI